MQGKRWRRWYKAGQEDKFLARRVQLSSVLKIDGGVAGSRSRSTVEG